MIEVRVCLEFACHTCARPVQVKLKCAGPGLLHEDPRAAVEVPCPWCSRINEVVFDPTGVVHQVAPGRPARLFPEPSLN